MLGESKLNAYFIREELELTSSAHTHRSYMLLFLNTGCPYATVVVKIVRKLLRFRKKGLCFEKHWNGQEQMRSASTQDQKD